MHEVLDQFCDFCFC